MSSILERDVKYLDEQYRLGKAIISDEAFDQLEKNLQKTYPLCNYFQQKKSLALPSIKSSNYKQFLKTLRKNTRLSIQPKIDGCAIAIQYLDGRLHKAIKNDGNDITNKIKNVKNIPSCIPIKRNIQVRGELYLPNKAGLLSQSITSRYIESNIIPKDDFIFCCFQILNGRLNQYESMNYLKKCGFQIPHSYFINNTCQVEYFRKEWLRGKIFANYPTDGIVIKINSRKLQFSREINPLKREEWQYAIKT